MQPVSTYASLMAQTNAMTASSQLSQKLSYELTSGKRAVDLADNPDRQQVLDLSQTKDGREAYVKSITIAQVTSNQYADSLSHVETIITTALKSVQGLLGTTTGQPSFSVANPTDPNVVSTMNQFRDLGNTINQLMTDTAITLNDKSAAGNGYLYAGLRTPASTPTYTLPPVRDLTTLPYFLGDVPEVPLNATLPAWPPAPAVAVAPPTGPGAVAVDPTVTAAGGLNPGLPTYDADYQKAAPAAPLPSQLVQAWGVQKVTIDDREAIPLNITTNAPAFQNLINGLRAAKTAADQAGNYSTTTRDQYISQAYSCLSRALSGGLDPTTNTWDPGIRELESWNSENQVQLNSKLTVHNTDLSVINSRLDTLVGVDTTTVTVQLATANNQLQASYKATASLLGMSLMNYLK